jgi:hypothetical protein
MARAPPRRRVMGIAPANRLMNSPHQWETPIRPKTAAAAPTINVFIDLLPPCVFVLDKNVSAGLALRLKEFQAAGQHIK